LSTQFAEATLLSSPPRRCSDLRPKSWVSKSLTRSFSGGSGSTSRFKTRIAYFRCSPLTAANPESILIFSSELRPRIAAATPPPIPRRERADIEALMIHLDLVIPPEIVPVGNKNHEAMRARFFGPVA
jgi:hypothetical protein